MANFTGIEQFQCEGDPFSLGSRWEKWRRALQIYLEASEITDAVKKRAILLHSGGIALQDIFYSLPGANLDTTLEENRGIDVFSIAISKLNDYFLPKQSKLFERYTFRLMKQDDDEKFDKFLVRLRQQAGKCQFMNIEEHLIDQITEKGTSKELRRKILSLGDNITLSDIIAEANALESVNRQMEKFEERDKDRASSTGINKIYASSTQWKKNKTQVLRQICSRCGNRYHDSQSPKCPAKDAVCRKCNFTGHFEKYCKSRRKRTLPQENIFFKISKTEKKLKILIT